MLKKIPILQVEAIFAALKEHPQGLSIEELSSMATLQLPRRTLQRRLAQLVASGQLQKQGARRSTRYGLTLDREENKNKSLAIFLSPESRQIQAYLQQPLKDRRLVAYKREFLYGYRPNETAYLTEKMRKHLWELGGSFSHERPAGTYAKEILSRLLIDLSWNSSRLEGNTYSLLETERLLVLGEATENKSSFEAQMLLNHKAAIEFLVEAANEVTFNAFTILNLHALLANNLLSNPQAYGQLRKIKVGIKGAAYQPPEMPQQVGEYFEKILSLARAIIDPFEQAFFVMVQLPYLQAFEDVNKRVSRLAANIPLIKQNLCPLSFIDVTEQAYVEGVLGIYELNRIELMRDLFMWAYERSARRYSSARQILGEPDPFRLRYHAQMLEVISQVVKGAMDKRAAAAFVQQWTTLQLAEKDRNHFIEVVESELLALQAGNIARFRLRLSEFEAWRLKWD